MHTLVNARQFLRTILWFSTCQPSKIATHKFSISFSIFLCSSPMAKHHDSSPFLFPSSFPSYMSEDSEPTTRPSSSLSPQISSSQSTSSVNSPFKPGFSNNVAINDSGVRTHQAQRVRTNTKVPPNGFMANPAEGERKSTNSELWHACAGPLVSLPPVGSLVVYFPQGHSEQVASSMQREADFIPSYPNLPSKLICMLHNVTLHADAETDEVSAQMTLQPVNKSDKEALLASDMGLKQNRQPIKLFCKTLTASDTNMHGGFSVPRRAAEMIFPPLDYSMQRQTQELVARDLHDNAWTFRHIYRGLPKRHLLTAGWIVFVRTKRLFVGDSVLFIRDEKSQLLLGIRRANRQQPALLISSDSMHIGILAAAVHAAANNSPFTVVFNPRASPTEFVIPFSKYNKAMYTQVSLGMRFRMMFKTEESGVRRYMGTITGISDLDSTNWKNSQWRNLQVGWDESTDGERPSRVSIWEIEPVVTPFYICPPFFRSMLPEQPGMSVEDAFRRAMP